MAGDVIVEVAQEAVASAADIKKRVDQLKKDGKKSVLLLVANAEGELRFVALGVQWIRRYHALTALTETSSRGPQTQSVK